MVLPLVKSSEDDRLVSRGWKGEKPTGFRDRKLVLLQRLGNDNFVNDYTINSCLTLS